MTIRTDGHPALEDLRGLDAATLDASQQIAEEGAEHARALGLNANARVASTNATASEAIVEAADEINASIVVLGSRGRQGSRATILGSTSTKVLHATGRPTLVIPAVDVDNS